MSSERAKASEEQLIYAKILGTGTWLALGLLVILFIIYITGVLPNVVDFEKLQYYWTLRASEYIESAGAPIGWEWVKSLNHGDMLNFIGITLLAGMTIICYLIILPVFIRKKDLPYTIITIVEILVLLLAASGILTAGH